MVLGVAVLKFHGGRERHLTLWQVRKENDGNLFITTNFAFS